MVQQEPGAEGAHHVLGAVREVDDVEQAEDDREAEAQHRVERAVDQPEQELAEQGLGGMPSSSSMRSILRVGRMQGRDGHRPPHFSRCRASALLDERAAALVHRAEGLRRPGSWRAACSSPTAPFDSAGFFTSNRYMSWILRPSSRTCPCRRADRRSAVSFIFATTLAPSVALQRLDRLQVVHHGRIDAGLHHGRHGCRCCARRTASAKARVWSFRSQ